MDEYEYAKQYSGDEITESPGGSVLRIAQRYAVAVDAETAARQGRDRAEKILAEAAMHLTSLRSDLQEAISPKPQENRVAGVAS